MSLHFFDLGSVPVTPWKNGGGLTQEIVCVPVGAGLGDFDWRVSVAQVKCDGPFSIFQGIDRVIVLLNGKGMRLAGSIHQHELTEPLLPHAFAGEIPISCTLVDGPTIDLNVMTRRQAVRADVSVVTTKLEVPFAQGGMLYVAKGTWQLTSLSDAGLTAPVEPIQLSAGQGVWWHRPEAPPQTSAQNDVQAPHHFLDPFCTVTPHGEGHLVGVQIHKAKGVCP
jgi:uncharacterized protein